jgi:uncharacterized protein (TIGR02246 family)
MRIGIICLAVAAGLCSSGHLWVAGEPRAKTGPGSTDSSREADRKAILQSARDFCAAFQKGDAKALAAQWTEEGEYESDDGTTLRGRGAIEAAFAAYFKDRPAGKMEIKVENIRFPSRDTAIEEGLAFTTTGDALPSSAPYRALHVREDGKWRIALSREWAAGENRMADLDWLVGSWRGHVRDGDMVISFTREKDQPFVVGNFGSVAGGKTVSLGTMKIGLDPVSGQLMSWHFDPDGGHGHGAWLREGKHWVVDSHGIQGNGTETAAVNILTRLGDDEVSWRSIDRMVGGQAQPDTPPVSLKRVGAGK